MAHVNFHLAVGMAAGTLLTAMPLARAWLASRPVAAPILRTVVVAFGLGLWAVVPSALTSLGAPAAVHHAWWANVFVGHAAIDRRIEGGLMTGELAVAAYLIALYLLVLVAIVRARRLATPGSRHGDGSRSMPAP